MSVLKREIVIVSKFKTKTVESLSSPSLSSPGNSVDNNAGCQSRGCEFESWLGQLSNVLQKSLRHASFVIRLPPMG